MLNFKNIIQAICNLDLAKIAAFLDEDSTHNLLNKAEFIEFLQDCIYHLKDNYNVTFIEIRELDTEIEISGLSHTTIMFEFGDFYFIWTIIATKNGLYKVVECNSLAELDNKSSFSFQKYEHLLALELKFEAFVIGIDQGDIEFWDKEDLEAVLNNNKTLIDLIMEARYYSSDFDKYAILTAKLGELLWGFQNEYLCKEALEFYNTLPVNIFEDRINWYRKYEANLKYLKHKDIDLSQIHLGYFSALSEYFLNIRFGYKNHEGFIQFLKTFELCRNHCMLDYKEADYPYVDNKYEVDWYQVCKSLGLLKNQKQDLSDF